LIPIADTLYNSISVEKGNLSELVAIVTKLTLAYKLGVLEQVLRQA
jgi:hypothetical protein